MERGGENRLFGTDGIRALANRFPLDVETAAKIGRAIGRVFSNDGTTIYIGQDTRLSSDMLSMAVAAGICSSGMNACMLGVIPTAGVAYFTRSCGGAAGVVISASHNPFEDNGIKVFQANGQKITILQEKAIENRVSQTGKGSPRPGRLVDLDNKRDGYLQFLKNNFKNIPQHINIVIDCANGATSDIAPLLFSSFGIKLRVIASAPDGRNINADCGTEHPGRLAKQVLSSGAAMGFAFDGDGDRLLAVDEKGNLLNGDQLLAIFAAHYQKHRRLKSKTVVATVMSNLGLKQALRSMGLDFMSCPVGDRNVAEAMQENRAVIGGEPSGHIILRDIHTTGDGLLAAMMLLEAVHAAGLPLSELCQNLIRLYPQKLVNVQVGSKPRLDSIAEIRETISKVEQELGPSGRVLVRYSGTQSLCRVMVEAEKENLAAKYAAVIAECIDKHIGR